MKLLYILKENCNISWFIEMWYGVLERFMGKECKFISHLDIHIIIWPSLFCKWASNLNVLSKCKNVLSYLSFFTTHTRFLAISFHHDKCKRLCLMISSNFTMVSASYETSRSTLILVNPIWVTQPWFRYSHSYMYLQYIVTSISVDKRPLSWGRGIEKDQ